MSASTEDKISTLKRRPTGYVPFDKLAELEDDSEDDEINTDESESNTNIQQAFIPVEKFAKVKYLSEIDANGDDDEYEKLVT